MKIQRIALGLTVLNMLLLVSLLVQTSPAVRAEDRLAEPAAVPAAMLRGRGLEIVGRTGRVRALLAVQPPVRVDGRDYPETVLLRLIDPTSGPVVKLTASKAVAALGLSDDAEGGVQIFARDTGNFVKVVGRDGSEKIVEP